MTDKNKVGQRELIEDCPICGAPVCDFDLCQRDTEIENLKQLNEKYKLALEFYADPENWMIKTGGAWKVSNPRKHGDENLIRDYNHPNCDWIGTINAGGKRARQALENK